MDSAKQDRVKNEVGFIAALDQSGGSTPKALKLYGIEAEAYPNQEVMLDLVHEMRTRIITSPSFDGARILGAILFEDTMNRYIEGTPTGITSGTSRASCRSLRSTRAWLKNHTELR